MLATPEIARYVAGWGRPGDAALVAEDSSGGLIGGAWYRLFAAAERGFGFIDSTTPELSIAVVRTRRRQGVGSALLAALIRQARRDGYPDLSLSVSPENPAASLYEQHGFVRVASHDEHWTMRLDLGSQSGSVRGE